MFLTQKLMPLWHKLRAKLTKRVVLLCLLVLFFVVYAIAFFPRTIQFSYAGDTCVPQLTVLPQILKSDSNAAYKLTPANETKVFGYPLLAHSVCAEPTDIPKQGDTRVSLAPLGWFIGKKNFVIKTDHHSTIAAEQLDKPLPTAQPLELALSQPDTTFTYRAGANQQVTDCDPLGSSILCDLGAVGLAQGSEYTLRIDRYFKSQKVETIVQKDIKTLPAAAVTASSVTNGQTVYDKPSAFTFTTDKPLKSAKATLSVTSGSEPAKDVAVITEVEGSTVTVRPGDQLVRSSGYTLTLQQVEAIDGSSLAAPHAVNFKVSGGPKVTGVSIGGSGVSSSAAITIQLDQSIHDSQDVAKFVTVSGGAAAVSKAGDKIVIKLAGLPRCTDFTIKVAKGLKSQYDVENSIEWQHASRTVCHTVSTIGYSVQGRPINAYYFGSGATTVLYTGAIHGNEQSSRYLTQQWIDELEAKARDIPADRQIVVIPVVNPDGIARSGRNNARNVNLNRNFPTFNWTSDTAVSSGSVEKGAGGPSPLSEPESKALASFTLNLRPRFIITYHSKGSLVNSNDVGISIGLGQQYARLAGYGYISNAATNETFGFTMTGTYEDWLIEQGIPAILIELNTDTGYHFKQNRAAMWATIGNWR
ncbi:Bacteriocin BCN5 [compost metagenome]